AGPIRQHHKPLRPGRTSHAREAGRFCVGTELPIWSSRPSRPFAGRVSHGPHDPFAKAPPLVTIRPKYVNMADVTALPASRTAGAEPGRAGAADEPIWDVIELLFFAYRDFVGDPDEVLAKFGFGRAHHRVLHFVNRHPGMKVADLLELLRITKQSLGRVLRELVEQGYVVQKAGENDRRQRLLQVTPKGEALAMRLAKLQTERLLGRA